jgi:hypothetical protein
MVLIVAMVIISSLGLGIIYIFSSSNLNPISGNYAQRAYYNAEAGFRYLTALYRVDGDTAIFNNTTYSNLTLPGGGTVTISATTPTTQAAATAVYHTGDSTKLDITITSGTSFPDAPGVFSITSALGTPKYYHYVEKTGNTLSNIRPSLTGFVPGSTVLTAVPQTRITSTGTYGGGLFNVSRTINYQWPLTGSPYGLPTGGNPDGSSGGPGGSGGAPYAPGNDNVLKFNYGPIDQTAADVASALSVVLSTVASYFGISVSSVTAAQVMQYWYDKGNLLYPYSGCGYKISSWGSYQYDSTQSALKVNSSSLFFLPYNYNFLTEWTTQGQKLSYDAQTKVKIGGVASDPLSLWLSNKYLVGISVRADSQCSGSVVADINQYGVSFSRGANGKFSLPNNYDPYIVFWRSVGSTFHLIAYKKMDFTEGMLQGVAVFDDMETDPTSNGWSTSTSGHSSVSWSTSAYYSGTHSEYMQAYYKSGDWTPSAQFKRSVDLSGLTAIQISFWHKSGGSWNSAYDSANIQVCSGSGCGAYVTIPFKPGSTSLSVPKIAGTYDASCTAGSDGWVKCTANIYNVLYLTSSSVVRFILSTTSGSGNCYIDDVSINAVKLKDWATLGVRLRETSATRSNQFQIFYGDTSSSSGNGTAIVDVNRNANPRNENNWLPMPPVSILTSTQDKLTVVSSVSDNAGTASANPWYWANGSAATSGSYSDAWSCSYTLADGIGSLEKSTVIKTSGTNCRTTDTFYTSSMTHSPEEFGLHVYSPLTVETWFDDTNILITGRGTAFQLPFQW